MSGYVSSELGRQDLLSACEEGLDSMSDPLQQAVLYLALTREDLINKKTSFKFLVRMGLPS